jgi:gliding motility-associated-like protein
MKKWIALLVLLLPGYIFATSTSGASIRGLNIDGFVDIGSVPGTNNTLWETDEVFQGFSGFVNWYMTWDDTYLYLGKIGGNNTQGAVIYLRAEYPGSNYTTTGFNYDGLVPEVSPMGGVNFTAYLKDVQGGNPQYDEFRTWSGAAWSAPTTTLTPFFSTPANGHNMEVRIPWSAITNGNGKPANIRAVLYQVVPQATAGCTPAAEFVYAESPWGTGNPGDGPSVGVNDGTPTSLVQPGGCAAGTDTARRWWGCYPVIGGVGSNGWQAVQPNAGPDSIICSAANAYILDGNQPPIIALGTWTLLSQPAGSPPVTIVNPNAPSTFAQNLTGFGDYTFIWDINYGGCPSLPDTLVISRWADPPPATVSPDQQVPCEVDSALIFGNDPGPQINGLGGQGQWVLISGQGSINTPSDTMTWVTALGYGPNIFEWQITNGPCQMTTAQVTLTRYRQVFADAGPDLDLCGVSIVTMDANDPIQIQFSANGSWSQISGPTQGVFTAPNFFNTNVAGLGPGTYRFAWSVTNGTCPADQDTVTVRIYDRPISDAGGDQYLCFDDVLILEGNDPLVIAPTATGVWQQQSGVSPAIFGDSTLFNTPVGNTEPGAYKFNWIVRNGPCLEASDQLTVFVTLLTNGGLASVNNADQDSSNGSVVLNAPINGAPPFLYSLDQLNWQNSAQFGGLGAGSYTAYYLDDQGCTDSLNFEIEVNVPPPSPKDSVVVTTGFSPNGDGTNDTWQLPGLNQFPEAVVEIYNLWGGLIYRSEGSYTPWNGTYNGKDMPPATYYFIIDLNAPDQVVRKGNLTLLR